MDRTSVDKTSASMAMDEYADHDSVIERDVHADMDLLTAIKKWRRTIWICVGMTSAILLYGYDYVIVGTVSSMPSFQ